MSEITVFLSGVGLTGIVCFSVVGYLSPHLQKILVDLCGTELRANFWMAFSNVTLVLVPVIFAMQYNPDVIEHKPMVVGLIHQFRWALIGLAGSVLCVGFVISRFIPVGPPTQQ